MVKIGSVELGEFPLLLAPMEDVSDPSFRMICKEKGADIVYTEFISSEGLIRKAEKSIKKLDIFFHERPIGIQIFGDNIDSMRQAAAISEEARPDLLDINYGCPVKKVTCKGAGAGILLDLPKMQKMATQIVKQVHIPVTVKTRLGWDSSTIHILEVVQRLQDAGVQAITIHARTRSQMYKGVADWSYIAQVKNHPAVYIPIFGNGDIDSPQKAILYRRKYHVDGIMIGRSAIGYPWIFQEIKHLFKYGIISSPPSLSERINVCRKHLEFSVKWKGERRGILEMRRHYNTYFKGLSHFKPYRSKLIYAPNHETVVKILSEISKVFSDKAIFV